MTETALVPYQSVTFQDVDLAIYEHKDNKWVTAIELSRALGYGRPDELRRLLDRKSDEFQGKLGHVKLTSPGGMQDTIIINYHGVIRAAMLAKTPKAKAFRDWAEDVLFTVMTQGHIDLRTPTSLELKQDAFHKDMAMLRQMIADDPDTASWVYPRIQALWDNYASNYVEPKIGITIFSEEWMRRLYVGLGWSKDTVRSYFPELTTSVLFENLRKGWGIPLKKAPKIPAEIALAMFRDVKQYHTRMDAVIRKYLYYSQDAIQKQLKAIENQIVDVLAANHVYGVKRYEKKSYADYRDTEAWTNKKTVLIAPEGPFDFCWDCLRPISLSTVHLHHMTYARIGFELWTDFRPLCGPCHAHRHAEKIAIEQAEVNTTNGGVTITNAMAIEETEKAILCTINGQNHWFPKSAVLGISEVLTPGDVGALIVKPWIAKDKGFA
jgi:prophage antirepressor-like protein